MPSRKLKPPHQKSTVRPIKLGPSGLGVRVITGPLRDIVVAQSLKCTVKSAQSKPPTQNLCPPPPLENELTPPPKLKFHDLHPRRKLKILTPQLDIQNSFYNPLKKMTSLEPKIEKSSTCANFEICLPHPQLDNKF